MPSYQIINTQATDLPFIYRLFDQAMRYQERNGYPVWPDYDREVLQQDIADRRQFKVMTHRGTMGVFSVCYADPLVWRARDRGNAIYLHRIVVNPAFKGQKLVGKVTDWARQQAKKQGLAFIRMDTWADNPTIIAYYESFGFRVVDTYTTPESDKLPIQQRGNAIVLLEHKV